MYWPTKPGPDNTQIYEGDNQIQRMVMARQLLKGSSLPNSTAPSASSSPSEGPRPRKSMPT